MDNKEDILDALNEFSRKPSSKIPPLLDQYLHKIATTGETIFPWTKLKPVFVAKLENCMEDFHEKAPTDKLPPCPNVENICYKEMKIRLLKAVNNFYNAPFTIQRLCELITDPHKHYKRTDKFLRGIEKNIMVVSCVDSYGMKIVTESKSFMNGMDSNGEMRTPSRKSSCNFLRLFAPPPAPSNSPVGANAESRLTESSSPTGLSPVSMWPLASRFISNNGDGPWPQVAAAGSTASIPLELSAVATETSKSGEQSTSSGRLQVDEESSSIDEKNMDIDDMPCSSEQMPSTTTQQETPTTTETVPSLKGGGDAPTCSVDAPTCSVDAPTCSVESSSSSVPMSSEADEASPPPRDEAKEERTEKEQSPEPADNEVSSSDVHLDESRGSEVIPKEETEAELSSEAENLEKPGSPSEKDSSEVSQSVGTNESDSISEESRTDIVSESTSHESEQQTVNSSANDNVTSPPSSESVSSSENSQSEKSEDISPSPSSSSSKDDNKDSPSQSEDQSSSFPSISDSTTPSEAPSEEAMEQD